MHSELKLDIKSNKVMIIKGLYKSFADNHVLKDFNLELVRGER
jgi:hypothetical protein